MKRQRRTLGAIYEVPLEGGKYYAYAQELLMNQSAFFDCYFTERITDLNVLQNCKIAFIIGVYNDIITKGIWPKVGKMPIRDELQMPPNKYVHDILKPGTFLLYNTMTGEMTPSTKEEVRGLEAAAAWDVNHVEDRLMAHFFGGECIWMLEDKKRFE